MGNMQAINAGNRRFFVSRHVAKSWEKKTLEDLNRLPPLRIIKSSYLFIIFEFKGQDLISPDPMVYVPTPSSI